VGDDFLTGNRAFAGADITSRTFVRDGPMATFLTPQQTVHYNFLHMNAGMRHAAIATSEPI